MVSLTWSRKLEDQQETGSDEEDAKGNGYYNETETEREHEHLVIWKA
jgi:hypothetical protein